MPAQAVAFASINIKKIFLKAIFVQTTNLFPALLCHSLVQ
jgi:hypothetical protein